MLKFIHTFAISLASSLSLPPPPSLSRSCTAFLLLLSAAVFWLFLRSTVKNYKQMGGKGAQQKQQEKNRQKHLAFLLLALLFSAMCSLFSVRFSAATASWGIYIFKWKVKLIINCEEKVAAYVFASAPSYFMRFLCQLCLCLCVCVQSSGQIFILVALSSCYCHSYIMCPIASIIKSSELISRCT